MSGSQRFWSVAFVVNVMVMVPLSSSSRINLPEEITCESDLFLCVKDDFCIPKTWQCDDTPDCNDGSDEIDCHEAETTAEPPFVCENNQFQCGGHQSIPELWRCDRIRDCIDGSDEINCQEAVDNDISTLLPQRRAF